MPLDEVLIKSMAGVAKLKKNAHAYAAQALHPSDERGELCQDASSPAGGCRGEGGM